MAAEAEDSAWPLSLTSSWRQVDNALLTCENAVIFTALRRSNSLYRVHKCNRGTVFSRASKTSPYSRVPRRIG
jgi:hypothetical protein